MPPLYPSEFPLAVLLEAERDADNRENKFWANV